ncbi:MAG: ABC transporter substrate-binding protein [Bacillota bacterium]
MKSKLFISLALFSLLSLITVAVCGENEKVALNVWDGRIAQTKYYEQEIRLFQEKYPYIEIKRTKQISRQYKDTIYLAARSDNLPDLYAPYGPDIMNDVSQGWCLPLDKWATKEWKKRFPKGSFSEGVHSIQGKTYLIPFEQPYVWYQLYINRKVFKEAGLVDKSGKILNPKTWAQFKEYAKIVTQKSKGKVAGFGMALLSPPGMFASMFYEWARAAGAAGGDFTEKFELDYRIGKYNLDHPAYVRVMNLLLDMKAEGSIISNFLSLDDETLRVKFANGEVGMILGGVWNQNGWAVTHPGWLDYEVFPIPAPDEKGYQCMQCVSPEPLLSTYFMSKNCKHQEEAWLFIDWLATPEAGARFVKMGIGQSVFPQANSRENAKTEQFAQYLDICRTYLRWAPNPIARNPYLAMVKWPEGDTLMPSRTQTFMGIMSGQIPRNKIVQAFKELNDAYNKELVKNIKEVQDKGYKVSFKDLLFPDWNPRENYGS